MPQRGGRRMWWRRRNARRDGGTLPVDPVVLAVTSSLTGKLAGSLAMQVERLSADNAVVIDLTAIPGFDSDGASTLAALQERHGDAQVSIVGFRQAAARLTGAADESGSLTDCNGWVVRRLHNLAVVQA